MKYANFDHDNLTFPKKTASHPIKNHVNEKPPFMNDLYKIYRNLRNTMSNYHIKHLEEYYQVYRNQFRNQKNFWGEAGPQKHFLWSKNKWETTC